MSTGGMLPVGGIDSVIPRNIEKHLCAIRLCMANQLTVPAIILIYTGIDFLASLTRPEGQQEVKSDDFIRWAEQYMSCKETLGVRGIDLYAARCGVVHSYRISSRLYRRAKANRIAYAWGRKEAGPADSFLKRVGRSDSFLKIETLFGVFCDSIEKLGKVIINDETLSRNIIRRSHEVFADYENFCDF